MVAQSTGPSVPRVAGPGGDQPLLQVRVVRLVPGVLQRVLGAREGALRLRTGDTASFYDADQLMHPATIPKSLGIVVW